MRRALISLVIIATAIAAGYIVYSYNKTEQTNAAIRQQIAAVGNEAKPPPPPPPQQRTRIAKKSLGNATVLSPAVVVVVTTLSINLVRISRLNLFSANWIKSGICVVKSLRAK